jgi:hypothetical protein
LYATEDIDLGDVVLAEKAFVTALSSDKGARATEFIELDVRANGVEENRGGEKFHLALWKSTVDKVSRNPAAAKDFMQLYSRDHEPPVPGHHLNVFQLNKIIRFNGLGVTTNTPRVDASGTPHAEEVGVWTHASRLRHSCIPNIARAFLGDLVVFRATRDIKNGDELTIAFTGMSEDYDIDKASLLEGFGITCGCECAKLKSSPSPRTGSRELR